MGAKLARKQARVLAATTAALQVRVAMEFVEPEVPDAQRGEGVLPLRYEDVTQDGRLRLEPITHAGGAALWRGALARHPMRESMQREGILPILSRLHARSLQHPIAVETRITCRGAFELVRAQDDRGRTRIRLDMGVRMHGVVGRTHGDASSGTGEPIEVGQLWAEHVLTRPFAAAAERAVDRLPEGVTTSLRDAAWTAPSSVCTAPEIAAELDAWALDPTPLVMGLGHTDSNQHVNSLVYPRLVEEAALRRFSSRGWRTSLFAQEGDFAFRKPSFAAETLRVALRSFRAGADYGVVAALASEAEADAIAMGASPRARVFARLRFTE